MIVKNVEKKEDNTLTFQVESDAAEFEAAVNAAYLKNKHSINIPGFRKGKAPRAVVEGMYGAEVFYQDAMDELAPKAFEQGVTENDVKFVGAPSIVDVNVTDDKTVAYTFSVTLYPEVTLGQYKGLSAERYPAEVDEDEIGYELEAARKRNSRKVDVEREAQMGDVANIDFDGYLNGERFDGGKAEAYDLELGSGSFVPGFEEQIVGMNIGDEKDIDITFPENYAPELAGKAVVFKIKLNNLSVNELPELDDEFAKDNGFDTLDEYKADVKADLEKRKTEQRDGEVRADLMHKAIENMTVAVPEVMVKEKAEEIIHRANLRGDDIIRDANELLQKASDRADEIISEANDKKLAEEREYDRVRLEVTRFKSDVLNLYRTHVESLSRLPEFQQKDETPAQDAEAELPETEDADTTEEAAPAADAAETEDAAPEKAGEDFWEKDESQLKLDPPPADPNAVFQGVSFSE